MIRAQRQCGSGAASTRRGAGGARRRGSGPHSSRATRSVLALRLARTGSGPIPNLTPQPLDDLCSSVRPLVTLQRKCSANWTASMWRRAVLWFLCALVMWGVRWRWNRPCHGGRRWACSGRYWRQRHSLINWKIFHTMSKNSAWIQILQLWI